MNTLHLYLSELRKLTTTRMPLVFVAILALMAVVNGVAVAFGTDMDGSKTFISTGFDQQSLVAFAANALMLAGLFGATASAREYTHNTIIASYLMTPHRRRGLSAQFAAIATAGAAIGVVGAGLTTVALAGSLPMTDYSFMVSASGVLQVLAAAAWAGAAGDVLGAAIGSIVRNTGGAVTGTVLALVIAPPVIVQLANGAAPWVPTSLALVVSGVASETGVIAAIVAIGLWALIPALAALWSVDRRDVV